jgi:Co/Zn/Cd efflux system component
MAINWTDVLTTVGGGGAVLAAAAYLIKTALTHSLTRDAEKFRVQLTADANTQIENLKSTLEMAALEHQVRFSNLHAKRAEVIATIYKKAFEVESAVQQYIMRHGITERTQERVQAYNEMLPVISQRRASFLQSLLRKVSRSAGRFQRGEIA